MYKDEMIHLHQFLVYVLKYLETNKNMQASCKEYISLNISPHHIHRTKADHKGAIFVLSNTITEVINKDKNYTIPENPSNSLEYITKKSKDELKVVLK
ncbi:UPF0058 family protein [Methanobrevibacter curvatus]|uniref:Uncharacterized protein n=1 Tax=Methanobrevibacter curvatus TaxID=49547 RepID=A0A166AIB1_9EURY|nr:UPF0058 family protein [Methanobrevibacter curvatus]KZX12069.1 hypothetical protein MBCUR_11720 [Methanobrevibacter curvatus]